jgi:hypothetical protein
MKFGLTILLATFTSLHITFGCDYKQQGDLEKAQKQNYEDSDLIFIGQLIELNDDGTFKFEILETFKGTERKYVELQQDHSCSILPSEDEKYWLVYIDEPTDGETVTISSCGLSRSFRYPYNECK